MLSLFHARSVLGSPDSNLHTHEMDPIAYSGALPPDFQFHAVKETPDDYRYRLKDQVAAAFGPVARQISDQAHALAEFMAELMEDPCPFVSLRMINTDYINRNKGGVSAHWHRDASSVTLQLTMLGAGLHCTPDSNVRREFFDTKQVQNRSDPDEALLYDPANFQVIPAGVATFLKGEMNPEEPDPSTIEFWENFLDTSEVKRFNVRKGLIHRGPGGNVGARLVLTVSSFRVPGYMENHLN